MAHNINFTSNLSIVEDKLIYKLCHEISYMFSLRASQYYIKLCNLANFELRYFQTACSVFLPEMQCLHKEKLTDTFLLLLDANIITDAVEDTAARSCVHVTSTMANVTYITDSRQILLYVQEHISFDSATVAGDAFQLQIT